MGQTDLIVILVTVSLNTHNISKYRVKQNLVSYLLFCLWEREECFFYWKNYLKKINNCKLVLTHKLSKERIFPYSQYILSGKVQTIVLFFNPIDFCIYKIM
jgi:hypothetical protein